MLGKIHPGNKVPKIHRKKLIHQHIITGLIKIMNTEPEGWHTPETKAGQLGVQCLGHKASSRLALVYETLSKKETKNFFFSKITGGGERHKE